MVGMLTVLLPLCCCCSLVLASRWAMFCFLRATSGSVDGEVGDVTVEEDKLSNRNCVCGVCEGEGLVDTVLKAN